MSRSGYSDDYGDDDTWALVRWRGAVASAIRGKRGQAFLRELIAALDAMPEKRLLANVFANDSGCCAMGAVALSRGIDPEDVRRIESWSFDDIGSRQAAKALGIAGALAKEIAHENDEGAMSTPEHRWQYMRAWARSNIRTEGSDGD